MKRLIYAISILIFSSSITLAQEDTDNPLVTIHTSKGDIRLELYQKKSPVSVANFLQYAKDGFYEGTIFHRVISHFMIQGGGMTADMKPKPTREPIVNEADNGLKKCTWYHCHGPYQRDQFCNITIFYQCRGERLTGPCQQGKLP